MMTLRALAFAFVAGAFALQPTLAQETPEEGARIADAQELEAAVVGHERPADRTRADLAEILSDERVREMAESRGLDPERAAAALATMSDEQVLASASLVETAKAALQGRGTITISVSALIIILLLILLLN